MNEHKIILFYTRQRMFFMLYMNYLHYRQAGLSPLDLFVYVQLEKLIMLTLNYTLVQIPPKVLKELCLVYIKQNKRATKALHL